MAIGREANAIMFLLSATDLVVDCFDYNTSVRLRNTISSLFSFQGFLAVGELDPLNRRLGAQKKPDVVVQVVILAEDNDIQDKLAEHDLHVQTIAEVAPIEVQPARVLSHLYTYLGRNKKLGLSGRKSRDVGILSTSKLYSLKDRIFAFTPQVKND